MNIVITGASKGIGKALAEKLGKDATNRIVCISRNIFDGENSNGNIFSVQFDLKNNNNGDELPALIKKQFDKIDVLINNAGTLINKPFEQLNDQEWKEIFEVNFFAAVRLTRQLLGMMMRDQFKEKTIPHIVNIGSIGAIQGSSKFAGLSAYSASKAALANFTECLAEELKENNIRVNCICLGAVKTEMFSKAFPGIQAPVTPEGMADFLAWFCLNGHQTMNGKIIPVSLSTP